MASFTLRSTSALLLALFVGPALSADVTISVIANAGTGKFQLPDGGGDLPEGSTYLYGVLDTVQLATLDLSPGSADLRLSQLLPLFVPYGSFTFNASGEVAVIGAPLTGGSTGDQLSAFIYTPGGAELGIFSSTNSLWDYPADPGGATLSNVLIDIAYLGDLGSRSLVSAVPEPQTYALFLGSGILGFLIWRRCSRAALKQNKD